MDKATLIKEFEEWANREGYQWQSEIRALYASWLEATRRADKRAREECCEIIMSGKVSIECATEFEQAYNHAIDDAVQAIRATIPEQTK